MINKRTIAASALALSMLAPTSAMAYPGYGYYGPHYYRPHGYVVEEPAYYPAYPAYPAPAPAYYDPNYAPPPPPQGMVYSQPAQGPNGYCREFTRTIIIDGHPQKAYGTSCRQPDGSWRIVP